MQVIWPDSYTTWTVHEAPQGEWLLCNILFVAGCYTEHSFRVIS